MLKMIFLIVISSLLFGCNDGLPESPVKDIYPMDVTHGVCTHYKYAGMDGDKIIWKKIEELPLSKCNGFISVSPKDYLAADDWRIEVQTQYKCTRKK